uniref:ATP synthase F0 subunit 6 n=1 Tax=Leptophyton benayahui TaxID=767318 RepID=UPI001FAF0D70|nr:ATP synthase F0 subunit 6 [Leptophyton benayahui]UKP88408.1 ATP synthase F0 subunit 6 [Leptophyton benayahui]
MSASFFDQFNVVRIFSTLWGGVITSSSIIMVLVVIVAFWLGGKPSRLVPSRMQAVKEIIVNHFAREAGPQYFAPIVALFTFIAGVNLLGLFPYVFSPTAHVVITFGISLSVIIAVTILGVAQYRWDFASTLMPSGAPLSLALLLVPIETVSYLSRAVSLGVRLAANLSAGHLLFAILASFGFGGGLGGLTAIVVMVFITLLEVAVALIQAYVFCLLTMIYIQDASELGH